MSLFRTLFLSFSPDFLYLQIQEGINTRKAIIQQSLREKSGFGGAGGVAHLDELTLWPFSRETDRNKGNGSKVGNFRASSHSK